MRAEDRAGRRKGMRVLLVLAVVVVLLLVVEGILVATVTISPTANEAFSKSLETFKRSWEGEGDEPGIPDRIRTSTVGFYERNIRTLWAAPEPPKPEPTFATCSSCHEGFEKRRRFEHVYMNHPIHEQEGVSCAVCHTQVAHPSPLRPSEATCEGCHEEVNEKGKCEMCHPPGSLPHFFLLGAPRDASIECTTCHFKKTFTERKGERLVHARMDGRDRALCLSCHDQPTCLGCHMDDKDDDKTRPESPHPSSWSVSHGPLGDLTTVECSACHIASTAWCFYRCHGVTPLTPFSPQPLPKEPLP